MEPRYAALAREMAREIAAGRHPVGSLLPGEIELAERHGLSRATIRAALRQLQDQGLISRRKRAGTRVERLRPGGAYAQSLGTVEDLAQYASETERRVHGIEEVVADEALAVRLGCKPGQRWLHLATTRDDPARPGRPLSCTSVYVEPAFGEAVRREVGRSTELISTIIAESYGTYVAEVRQEIRAIAMPAELAERMGCEPGSAALELTRHYHDQAGRVFEITISVHPGDRFGYSLTLRRVSGQQPGAGASP